MLLAAAEAALLGLSLTAMGLGLLALWVGSFVVPAFGGVRIGQALLAVLLLAAAVGAWTVVPAEVEAAQDRMQRRLDRGGSLQSTERLGVFVAHAAMLPLGHLVGAHEAAWEVLALHTGGGPYTWEGDVVLRDPVARRVARGWAARVAAGQDGPFGPHRLSWPGYSRADRSLRAALALDPTTLRGRAVDRDGVRHLVLDATVDVSWPPRHGIPLGSIGGTDLHLQEGLFHDLQRAGWITPVTVTWTVTLPTDDPRLQGEAVRRGQVEAALVGGGRAR